MEFTPAALRARFNELGEQRDAILADLDPIREARDALVAEYQDREREFNDQIKELSNMLYPIDQERGMIVRALNGKTGEPVEEDESPAVE